MPFLGGGIPPDSLPGLRWVFGVSCLCLSFLVFTELIPRPNFETPALCQVRCDSDLTPSSAILEKAASDLTPPSDRKLRLAGTH